MAILENILDGLGIDREIRPYPYRFSVFGRVGGWFEGIEGMESFSPEEVVLRLKKGKLRVSGRDLAVRKYGEKEIARGGEILSVTAEGR